MNHETGSVGAGADVHAVQRTLNGPRAVCGAGPITARVPGRFDPAHGRSCGACTALDLTGRSEVTLRAHA